MAAAGMPGGHSTVVTLIPVDNPTLGSRPIGAPRPFDGHYAHPR